MGDTQLEKTRPSFFGFYGYPPVGEDDWRYMFQTAEVRALEMHMLPRAALMDMANAPDFAAALGSLSGTEYTLPQGAGGVEIETVLRQRRAAARHVFTELMLDERLLGVFRSRDDFANLRLALRRMLTERPLGTDYSPEGNVPLDLLRQAFEEENYAALPDYMQRAIDEGVLAYYQNKDIRQIDFALDRVQADYKLETAEEVDGSTFVLNLFRIQIDLTNIRTMLRVKFLDADARDVFLDGGFLEFDRLRQGVEMPYEQVGALFYATPYHHVVEPGAAYLAADGSFLKLEQQCDEYMLGFLRQTGQITAGPQPVVAFLLVKEQEIRTVRLVLTAKRNNLETKLILDRLA